MTNVLRFPRVPQTGGEQPTASPRPNRTKEAALLRQVIKEGASFQRDTEVSKVAERTRAIVERHARRRGRGAKTGLCRKLWPSDPNPTRRLHDVKNWKKARKFADLIHRISLETGESEDDLLLDVFRDTALDQEVERRINGRGPEPELAEFWSILSETLHALVQSIARVEGLDAHLERMVALQGQYNLATGSIRPSGARFVWGPLANESEIFEDFPPIPSVVLFREPKSPALERQLRFNDRDAPMSVEVTIWREVRLAIGPVDNLLVPGPLFEFRSVLGLRADGQDLPVRSPWLFLESIEEIEVQMEGAWRQALLDLNADPGAVDSGWRFPAALEEPLQLEHSYIVWRPVTSASCRDLLLRPRDSPWHPCEVKFADYPCAEAVSFCPRGTIGEALEMALAAEGSDSLAARLRAEARRLTGDLRSWHVDQAAAAEAAHRDLRSRWESWT